MNLPARIERLTFIGFGEAARAFASGFGEDRPAVIRAYDRKSDDPGTRADMAAAFAAQEVTGATGPSHAVGEAQVVLCLVTASQALAAAEAAAPHLASGAFWFDGNSCAPETKRRAAGVIGSHGGRYIDMAIMAPVHPAGIRVPVLLSGAHLVEAAAVLESLGFQPKPAGPAVGAASSIKMIRSVMIKGMEALAAECLLAARRAGVDAEVLATLQASDPYLDWAVRGAYNLERMMVHGTRRAEEMREVIRTLDALGLPSGMSAAAADWQAAIAGLSLDAGSAELAGRADLILAALDAADGPRHGHSRETG
jgi:3-hydroxyisobutyrate dehydrogenase-like beta-hydroxyacid dehydrogenase